MTERKVLLLVALFNSDAYSGCVSATQSTAKAPRTGSGKSKEKNLNRLGEAIYTARRANRMSQRELGLAVGVSQGSVTAWERGVTSDLGPGRIFALEEALELDPGTLSRLCEPHPFLPVSADIPGVVDAIHADKQLKHQQKEALLVFYNSLVGKA